MNSIKNMIVMVIMGIMVIFANTASAQFAQPEATTYEAQVYGTPQQTLSGAELFNRFNTILTQTPDSVKSSILLQLPNNLKGYAIQFIGFLKNFMSEENKINLEKLQALLQQSIIESQQKTILPTSLENYTF